MIEWVIFHVILVICFIMCLKYNNDYNHNKDKLDETTLYLKRLNDREVK